MNCSKCRRPMTSFTLFTSVEWECKDCPGEATVFFRTDEPRKYTIVFKPAPVVHKHETAPAPSTVCTQGNAFKVGDWVRLPVGKHLALITGLTDEKYLIDWVGHLGDSINLDAPLERALPKTGEWWKYLCSGRAINPIEDFTPDRPVHCDKREKGWCAKDAVAGGCLVPVNFGKGDVSPKP